jgi:RanBP-type and C3HC4-type zinc finger-containing protein 1
MCWGGVGTGKGYILKNCGHEFCGECLLIKIREVYESTNNLAMIRCPEGNDLKEEWCYGLLELSEIKQIMPKDEFDECSISNQTNELTINDYMVMAQYDDGECILSQEVFDCPVCMDTVDPGNGIVLRNCLPLLHHICHECLKNASKATEEAYVKCPTDQCDLPVFDREVRSVLTHEEYNLYQDRGLAQTESVTANKYHCKTADCPIWVVLDDDEVADWTCDACGHKNCVKCDLIHDNQTCQEYKMNREHGAEIQQTAEQIEQMMRDQMMMQCPNCKAYVQKDIGCDAITCRCKTELCWATKGPRWGPLGKGDLTGGCRCRQPNLCHPNCGNCH